MSEATAQATATGVTVEQCVTHDRPTEPHLSPDGALVAFVRRPVSRSGEHWETAIWIAPTSGEAPRPFTSGMWHDRCPRWSPDGQRLAFLSDRAERGKSSIYVMPRDGGEAIRAFDQQGELDLLDWSPDGRWLSVLMVEPETDEERQRRERREDWHVWDTEEKFQRLWLVDPQTKQGQVRSPEHVHVWSYAWAPDGQRLALATTPSPKVDDLFGETSVWLITVDGEARQLFTLVGLAEDLTWSADGRFLAYRARAGRVVCGEAVYRYELATGETVCLYPAQDGTAEGLAPLAGGEALALTVVNGLTARIEQLTWTGERTLLVEPHGVVHGVVSTAAGRLAAICSDSAHLPSVWCWSLAEPGTPGQRLTAFHPEIEAGMVKGERITWESDPGVTVEGLLFRPPSAQPGQRLPLVVQIHGGPTSFWGDECAVSWHDWAQALVAQGYAVLLPNPRGSTGRGSAWTNAIFDDVGGGELRDVLTGVRALVERGIADPERLGVAGWSWGGYLTAWAVTQTDQFKAAVMGAGLSNLISDNYLGDIPRANLSYFPASPADIPDAYWQRSPIRYVNQVTTPLLILHGEDDPRVAVSESIQFYRALRLRGAICQLVTYPREKHGFEERAHQRDLLERIIAWFRQYIPPDSTPGA